MVILWQTYKTRDLDPEFQEYVSRWKNMHPEFEYRFLNDNDLKKLISDHVPRYLDFYNKCTRNIERVDFARLVMMYIGGVYADLDTYPIKPIDEWLIKNKIIIGREPLEHARNLYKREIVLCNAFMISPPRQQFWLDLMDFLVRHYEPYNNPVYNTGPIAMTRFYEYYPEKFSQVVITNPCAFFPIISNGEISKYCPGLENSNVVHAWSNTWTNKKWWDNPSFLNKKYWYTILLLALLLFIVIFHKK